jgi:hypothetical protein
MYNNNNNSSSKDVDDDVWPWQRNAWLPFCYKLEKLLIA